VLFSYTLPLTTVTSHVLLNANIYSGNLWWPWHSVPKQEISWTFTED